MSTILQQARFRRRLLQSISRYSAVPDRGDILAGQLDRAIERYLSSWAVQSTVLHEGRQRYLDVPQAYQQWVSAQQGPVRPHDYRRFRPTRLSFFHKPRTTGGVRKICRFGDIERMWHVMARELIVAQHQPRPHIGDWQGRGREWQIDQIRSVLTSSRQVVVSADIVSAFASVNFDAVHDLPYLPQPLIRRVLDYRSHGFVRRERSEYANGLYKATRNSVCVDLERSPSGLMEGSPASNAIFSVLMDDLADHIGEGIYTFVYCDNIILIAPTMSSALQAKEALVRYLAGHRAGPFEIRSHECMARAGFEHLGYKLWKPPTGDAEIGLSRSAMIKLVDRLFGEGANVDAAIDWLRMSYNRCSGRSLADFYLFMESHMTV